METKINHLNYEKYFPEKSNRLNWNSLTLLPGGTLEPKTMKNPNNFTSIRYYTPNDIVEKMEFRIKNSQEKNREMFGYKWDYTLMVAKKIK